MPMPSYTPDGDTVHVNKLPDVYDVGTVTLLPPHGCVEADITSARFLVFEERVIVSYIQEE